MTMGRDEGTGRYQTEYHDEEFVAAVQSVDGPATTQEVAEVVGCNNATANRRLTTLAENEMLERIDKTGVLLWRVS